MVERFQTVKEVAHMLNVQPMTVYRLINSGKLQAYKVGRSMRLKTEDVDNFLQSAAVNPEPKRKRFSLVGLVEGDQPITKEDIDEVIQEWNKELP